MTFLLSRNFWFWPKSYLYFCSTRKITGLWRIRWYLAENQMNGKGLTMWFQVSCHKDREEATPFTVFGKLLKCKSSVRKQIFCVCELSQEIFLLLKFLLCSLTCETYITLQWCCSAHRDKGKAFCFVLFCFGCTGCLFPVWPFLYLRQVGATLCLQGAWLLVAVASFVVEHQL